MAVEDDAKSYRGALVEAESGLAQIIATFPEVAGFIEENTITGTLPVFALSDESAKTFIEKSIKGALKQAILVEFVDCASPCVSFADGVEIVYGLCDFRVSVASPGLLANSAKYNTQTILACIVKNLVGKELGEPFISNTPVKLKNISRDIFDDGSITSQAVLSIYARIF